MKLALGLGLQTALNLKTQGVGMAEGGLGFKCLGSKV